MVAAMDKDTPRPLQVSNDGNVRVVLADSEQGNLPYDANGTGRQGRSIANSSIGESGTPSSSIGPRRTKGGAVISCGAPPLPHVLFCACDNDGVTVVGDNAFASDNDDDNEEVFPSDAQLNLTRLLHAHAHTHARDHAFMRQTLMQKTKVDFGEDSKGHDDDSRDGGLWDLERDGELDDEKEEAVRQDSCVMLMCPGESPLPPAPDDVSTTERTYDNITKLTPLRLWCVVSPLFSLSPVLRYTAASLLHFCRRRPGVAVGLGCALRKTFIRWFGAWCLRECACTIVTNEVLVCKGSVHRRQDKGSGRRRIRGRDHQPGRRKRKRRRGARRAQR